ncbi:MAG: class I SAM-dependent methyltransferase [Gemmatimonadetes bacterium]|nr:class I SAM-dependent methyltransferase [Gemmatimonadota bacterium]
MYSGGDQVSEYDRKDAGLYDSFSTGLEGDEAFYTEEAARVEGPVLELGCGTGRIMIPVAESGVSIVGLDRAPAMLEVARRKVAGLPEETRQRIQIVEGDMRTFSLNRHFPLAIIPYRAFLHMMTAEDQRRALTQIHSHLTKRGRLVLNVFDPSIELIAAYMKPPRGTLNHLGSFTHPETGRRVLVSDTRRYDPLEQTLEEHRFFEEVDDEGRVIAKTTTPLYLRYVHRFEMQYLLELCGYEIEALYGDFQRGPFKHGNEQVWVARRI